jgi:hypothetical protein
LFPFYCEAIGSVFYSTEKSPKRPKVYASKTY